MSTASQYYDRTSDSQPIGVKMRSDLLVKQISYQGEPWWVVKDPYDQQYYRYNEQEFAILSWLDGKVSFNELREKFERHFSPYRVSYQELTSTIREFFKKSVVVATQNSNGVELYQYAQEKKREQLVKRCKSLLAVEIKGWDPTAFLDATYPLVRWFFSAPMVALNMMFLLVALSWLGYHYDQFLTRFPSLWSFLDSSNWLALGFTIAITKLLHELGHAYAHKRFGGECHEIGVMIFFFVPTMYCNTSDSWMFTDKWKRMAVGAAGVYIEMFVFSVATFTWWFSGSGMLQDLSLNLMVVCSISAALTNGNPLMRYDGYFVLSDWLEIPNLNQKSGKEIRRFFLNRCLGVQREIDYWTTDFNKRIYFAYGIASFLYKCFLMFAVGYVLIHRFEPFGLASVGFWIGLISIAGLFLQPARSMMQYFRQPGNVSHVRRLPVIVTTTLLAAIIGLIVAVPFPYYLTSECTVELSNQLTVYAPHSARIEQVFASPGERVEKGAPLVQLANEELDERILEGEADLEELKIRLDYQMTPSVSTNPLASSDEDSISSLETQIQKVNSELAVLRARRDSLLITAPSSGFVYGLTIGKQRPDTDDENLNQIYGNPLAVANQGGWLKRGDEICKIGEGNQQQVVLSVEQQHNSQIQRGQEVSILLVSRSNRLSGHIDSVSLSENRADDLPDSIYQGSKSPIVTKVKQAAQADKRKDMEFRDGQTLDATVLQAKVKLDDDDALHLNFASLGKARVFIGYRTLLWRAKHAYDQLCQRSF